MNSSPPKASNSSRPPAALGADGGRLITALAAGGSVLLLSGAAVALWPRTYGTEATFVVQGGAIASPVALAGRIEATLLEREELARVAIELPPELRSPDPIGRLRAGIRVQSRGALGYVVEFRGSEPTSVQRIANSLADRAVTLVPKLAAAPQDQAAAQALAARTRAVTEFLTAHPEVTVDPPSGGKATATTDSGLEALRTEKRQIEQRLTTGATDNPYADPAQTPEILNRRLTEIKNTIAKREKALKDPNPTSPPPVSPDLVPRWRQLLAELAAAQDAATMPAAVVATATARVTARAPLPTSPITPNRLVLSIVALLLSAAAALVAYVLPRKPEAARRSAPHRPRSAASDPGGLAPGVARNEPLRPRSEPPIPRSDPPPPPGPRPGSEPPAAIAVQRTVVLSGPSGGTTTSPLKSVPPARSHTTPGGLEAPAAVASVAASPSTQQAPSAGPVFGSRPPPGAGTYSVSSSHPPPMDSRSGSGRTSVERLSPLQSAHPPPTLESAGPTARHAGSPAGPAIPQIVSRPPALDPEAESWAAHFEAPPPPEPTRPTHPQPSPPEASEREPRKRAARWKTQAMGSMVPLEVMTARDEPPPPSEAVESRGSRAPARQVPLTSATIIVQHDVPIGWAPQVDGKSADVTQLRDAVLQAATGRSITLVVTGTGRERAQVAGGLGLALAEMGTLTLLVEADFDNPELHRAMSVNVPPGAGFSQQLMARRNARHPEPWTLVRCSTHLSVLPEGRFRSPGLVVSREFESALLDLREQHHIVIIHAPSLAHPEDLRPLGSFAQGAVLVEPNKASQLRLGENPLHGLV